MDKILFNLFSYVTNSTLRTELINSFMSPVWTPEGIFTAIITFSFITYFWETYLTYRQRIILKTKLNIPPEFAGVLDQASYTSARLYNYDKNQFELITSLWDQLLQTAILVFNGIPLLWGLSGRVIAHFGYGKEYEVTQTLVFVLIGSLITTIIDLPFSYYKTFVIEEKHGFNNQTRSFFFKDRLKKFIVMQVILLPILACIIHIIKIGGDYFFIALWIFSIVISLFLSTIYADYIAPLFDNFTPLQEGQLKTRIEELAASINFPLKKLFVVEGSKRSAHSNAYMYGFYKNKRIVLFDTLLQDYVQNKPEDGDKPKRAVGCNDDEVIAVLAHELGHWKMNHVIKNILIMQVNFLLCFSIFALLYKKTILYKAFGFHNEQPVVVGLVIIFQFVFSAYNEVLSFLMVALSRHFEFEADAFAKKLNKAADLRSALVKLNKDNLGFPVYDWLYTAWNHSHPPLLQRIRALGKID